MHAPKHRGLLWELPQVGAPSFLSLHSVIPPLVTATPRYLTIEWNYCQKLTGHVIAESHLCVWKYESGLNWADECLRRGVAAPRVLCSTLAYCGWYLTGRGVSPPTRLTASSRFNWNKGLWCLFFLYGCCLRGTQVLPQQARLAAPSTRGYSKTLTSHKVCFVCFFLVGCFFKLLL